MTAGRQWRVGLVLAFVVLVASGRIDPLEGVLLVVGVGSAVWLLAYVAIEVLRVGRRRKVSGDEDWRWPDEDPDAGTWPR